MRDDSTLAPALAELPAREPSGPSRPPLGRWRWVLGIWSACNAAAFALVAASLVSLWPPRGTAGVSYAGPGDGLFFLVGVAAPGGLTFVANAIVLGIILFSRTARRDGRVLGWWGVVALAWVAGLVIIQALTPPGHPLPG